MKAAVIRIMEKDLRLRFFVVEDMVVGDKLPVSRHKPHPPLYWEAPPPP